GPHLVSSLFPYTTLFRSNVMSTPLGSVLVRHLTAARVEDHLHELEKAGAAPASVNHVRAKLRTVFFKARKAGLWIGPNPITETEDRKSTRLNSSHRTISY